MTRVEGQTALSIRALDGEGDCWDAFLEEEPEASFCHLSGWRTIMSDVLGHECLYRVAEDEEGEWRGILPLVRVKSWLFGHYLLSMPFLNYGGPLGDEAARRALAEAARAEAERSGADLLELRSRTPVPADFRTSDRKITVLLDLPGDADVLWKEGLKSKVRSQVRRPRKAGMVFEIGPERRGDFYDVFARTMRDLGTPVLPAEFFERLQEVLGRHLEFGVVYTKDGAPAAVGCGFHFQGEFEITWAGFVREYSRQAPNMLLYWGFMEAMIARGAETFNFGRCTPGSGTHRFKSQWGGEDAPLPWAQWSPSGVTETPNPEGNRLYTLATELWSRMPLAVANRLGPIFARRLP